MRRTVDLQHRVQAFEAVRLGGVRNVVDRTELFEMCPDDRGGDGRVLRRSLVAQCACERYDLRPGRRELVRIEASFLEHVLVVPDDAGGGIERHRHQLAVDQTIVTAHGGDVGIRIELHAGFLRELPDRFDDRAGTEHGLRADFEHLRYVRRLTGTPCRGDRGQQVLVDALEQTGHLDLVLAGVERRDQLGDLLARRGTHRVPQRDAGLLGCARRNCRESAGRGQQSAARECHVGKIRRNTAGEPSSNRTCGRMRWFHGLPERARSHSDVSGTPAFSNS